MPKHVAVSLAIFAAAITVTSLFFINFCATVFQCGCQSLWGAADQFCNIHAAHSHHGVKGCPWCSFGYGGYALVFGTIAAAQMLVAFVPRLTWPVRLVLSLGAFPAVGGILALVLGLYTGYWSK